MDDYDELRQTQLKCLEILRVFKKFCDDNNLLFYFCGGCCIGTVRHKGFIPWDDDIDVFMPREDYEKLGRLWNEKMKKTKYKFVKSNKNFFIRSLFSYISDEDTTFIKEQQSDLDVNHGIRIEVIPLDGCPSSRVKRKIQIMWALTYQLFMNQQEFTSKGKFLEYISKFLLIITFNWKIRYKIAKIAEKHMTKYKIEDCEYVTELTTRYDPMIRDYPKDIFEKAILKKFEGELMPIPVGYDKYLKMAFGDYMKLPPKEDQIPKHEATKIDTKHSYKKYKGIFYCIKR